MAEADVSTLQTGSGNPKPGLASGATQMAFCQ